MENFQTFLYGTFAFSEGFFLFLAFPSLHLTPLPKKVLLSNSAPPEDMVFYVCGHVLPFLLRFFDKHMEKLSSSSSSHHPDAKKICNALLDATYLLYMDENTRLLCDDEGTLEEYLIQAGRLLKAMKNRDILGHTYRDKVFFLLFCKCGFVLSSIGIEDQNTASERLKKKKEPPPSLLTSFFLDRYCHPTHRKPRKKSQANQRKQKKWTLASQEFEPGVTRRKSRHGHTRIFTFFFLLFFGRKRKIRVGRGVGRVFGGFCTKIGECFVSST